MSCPRRSRPTVSQAAPSASSRSRGRRTCETAYVAFSTRTRTGRASPSSRRARQRRCQTPVRPCDSGRGTQLRGFEWTTFTRLGGRRRQRFRSVCAKDGSSTSRNWMTQSVAWRAGACAPVVVTVSSHGSGRCGRTTSPMLRIAPARATGRVRCTCSPRRSSSATTGSRPRSWKCRGAWSPRSSATPSTCPTSRCSSSRTTAASGRTSFSCRRGQAAASGRGRRHPLRRRGEDGEAEGSRPAVRRGRPERHARRHRRLRPRGHRTIAHR